MSIHFSTKGVGRSSGLLHVVEGLPLAELAVLLLYLLLAGLQVAVVDPAIKRIRKDADGYNVPQLEFPEHEDKMRVFQPKSVRIQFFKPLIRGDQGKKFAPIRPRICPVRPIRTMRPILQLALMKTFILYVTPDSQIMEALKSCYKLFY